MWLSCSQWEKLKYGFIITWYRYIYILYFILQQAADVDSGYDSLDGPNKRALQGKTGTFRPHMNDMMLTKNVRCPNREVLRRKIELFNQNTLGLIVSLVSIECLFDIGTKLFVFSKYMIQNLQNKSMPMWLYNL